MLRLRGRTKLNATAFIVLADYAQLRKTKRVDLHDLVTAIPASDTILRPTLNAYDQAE